LNEELKAYGKKDVIIRTTSRLMVPFIQLYALYVMVGTEGAGGGFQGGAIFAASFILFVTAFGITKGRAKLPESWNASLNSLGVYLYAGIGLLCVILSYGTAHYLNYAALPLSEVIGQAKTRSLMIGDVVEVGIGLTVMSVFVSIFFDLAWKGHDSGEEKEAQD